MVLVLDTTIGAGGVIIAGTSGSATTVTTASFSTAANIRLVAICASNGHDVSNTTHTVSTGGLAWTQEVVTGNTSTTDDGLASIWTAYSASALSSITVQCVLGGGTLPNGGNSISVVGLTGAEVTHGGAEAISQAESGAPSCAVTSTRDGSYIFSAMADWSAAGDPAVSGSSPAQTLLQAHTLAGQYSGGQGRSTDTVSIGTQTMGYTTSRDYVMAVLEIREFVETWTPETDADELIRVVTGSRW